MIPNGQYTAVVDRIEDGLASLLLEVSGEDAHKVTVDPGTLPANARHSDAVLEVTVADGDLVETVYDAAETNRRQEAAQRRFDRLLERPPDDEF